MQRVNLLKFIYTKNTINKLQYVIAVFSFNYLHESCAF